MKKLSFLSFLGAILLLTSASMCDSDDHNSSSDPSPVINLMTGGTWRVTSFIDSGSDETVHFNGYSFTFGAANVLTAANGTNTYTGTWSVTSDDSNDDSSSDLDFNILFSEPVNFTELTEDWHISSRTSSQIQLVHVSGGNGGTDYLTFEKN